MGVEHGCQLLATQRVFGLDFVSCASVEQVVCEILAQIRNNTGEWKCVVTPNVDHLVRYSRFDREARVSQDATIVLPDGMPIVWASRLLARPLRSRLTGSDLFEKLWPELGCQRIATVVVASAPAVADQLEREHSVLRCVVPVQFELENELEVNEIVQMIDQAVEEIDAQVVIIGVSMPKHHLLAALLKLRWSHNATPPMVLLLGAAPLFYLGLERRAPQWMQQSGLEWVHRLAGDPRRMARRYLIDDVEFGRLVWREWRNQRRSSNHVKRGLPIDRSR